MIRFRTMTRLDLDTVLHWAEAEGWAPGLDDARAFLAADPAGFVLAQSDAEGPVAALAVVNHSAGFATVGLHLCRPEWRGRGIGLALWRHALPHAGGRSLGLIAPAPLEQVYARSGFETVGGTLRLSGMLEARDDPAIRPAGPADQASLVMLDAQAIGYARPGFLGAWLAGADGRHTVVLGPPGQPSGFATIRVSRSGARIGPVVAPGAGAALRLIRAACARMPGVPVSLDLPQTSRALAEALTDAGLEPGAKAVQMIKGRAPLATAMQQAIATPELG